MITRQELEAYRFREIELEQQFAKLKMWQNKLTRLQTTYGSVGKSAEYQAVSGQLHVIIEETMSTIERTTLTYREVDSLIDRIPDNKIRAVMRQYYILCSPDWDDVVAVLGMSKRTVQRLHGYGLEIIKHLQEDKQICTK